MKTTAKKYIDKATLETMQARQKAFTEMSMKWTKGKTQEHKHTETTTKGKTTETENTFSNLIRNYENAVIAPKTEKEYTETLTSLAKAVAYSVLKKCIETSQNPQLIRVKQSIKKDFDLLDDIITDNNAAYALEYDTNGNLKQTVINKELHKALEKLEQTVLNDGIDLVQDAIVAIITETENARAREHNGLTAHFMENPYSVRRLKRKVYIKVEDSVKGWETIETTPIQEIYKAVRRSIENSRAVKVDAKNGYSYIEDIATDTETDTETVIYKRLPKYIDLGCTVVDYNGKETAYTVDEQTVTDIETIIASLNLSTQQTKILQLRLSGYGLESIATYMGVKKGSIQKQLQRIREKCIVIGFTPNK